MSNGAPKEPQNVRYDPPEEELEEYTGEGSHLTVSDIRKVKLLITAELGSCPIYVRDVLEMQHGTVLHLDKLAGEMADLLVGGLPLARGEVVVIGDVLHVRIAEVFGLNEREDNYDF